MESSGPSEPIIYCLDRNCLPKNGHSYDNDDNKLNIYCTRNSILDLKATHIMYQGSYAPQRKSPRSYRNIYLSISFSYNCRTLISHKTVVL